jgi:DNA-binding MltR family transcriptional regulator
MVLKPILVLHCIEQREYNGVSRPVAYRSHSLNAAEHNYATHDWELLAIVQALKM